jgi:hypothetical protein
VFSDVRVSLQGSVGSCGSRAGSSRGKIPCSLMTFDGVLRRELTLIDSAPHGVQSALRCGKGCTELYDK